VSLATSEFREFAADLLEQHGAASLPLVVVGHPVGGISREQAEALVTDEVVAGVIEAIAEAAP